MQINPSTVILCGWWNGRQIWALIGRAFFLKTEESEPPVGNRNTKTASLPIIYMIMSVYTWWCQVFGTQLRNLLSAFKNMFIVILLKTLKHGFQSAGIGKCSLCHLCRHTNLLRDIYRNALKTVISMLNIVSVKCNMTGIYWKLGSSIRKQ